MIPLEPAPHAPSGPAGPLPEADHLRLKAFALLLFAWVMIRNGWLSEDAFITFRVVDNFVNGLGLRWNVLDRVQVYTHPLWMFCVSAFYFALRKIYFAAIAPSFICSALAVWLVVSRVLRSPIQILMGAFLLTFSRAFVDYSSSGLENPLSHLLLVLFFLEVLDPQTSAEDSFSRMVWTTGLILVNRMDLIWLILPALAHRTLKNRYWRWRHLRLWAGLSVFAAWEGFSFAYYGLLLPNTAYVKLFNGIPPLHLIAQGGYYLINSMAWDPLTLFTMVALVAVGLWKSGSDRSLGMICLGVLLQLGYTVWIGGDYMSGRFLSAPFLVTVMLLSRVELDLSPDSLGLCAIFLAVGVWSPHPPIAIEDDFKGSRTNFQWVDDEHGLRASDTGFLRLNKNTGLKDINNPWLHEALAVRKAGTEVIVYPNIGYFGFFVGPKVHVIDPYGIGDPLLAHLPCDRIISTDGRAGECHVATATQWASGHFVRAVPDGYEQAAIGKGVITDPELEAYWERIATLTRGPIFDAARWKEIVRFNLGLDRAPHPR